MNHLKNTLIHYWIQNPPDLRKELHVSVEEACSYLKKEQLLQEINNATRFAVQQELHEFLSRCKKPKIEYIEEKSPIGSNPFMEFE